MNEEELRMVDGVDELAEPTVAADLDADDSTASGILEVIGRDGSGTGVALEEQRQAQFPESQG